MKKTNYLLLLSLGLMLLIASCGKDGSVGPTGVKGANGTQGLQGATGLTGATNVVYSNWFTLPSYTLNTLFAKNHYYYDMPAPQITQGVLDSGMVIVYGKLDNTEYPIIWPQNQVGKLPIILNYSLTVGTVTATNPILPVTDTWSDFITLGNIQIDFVNGNNVHPPTGFANSFRYVIIPAGVHASGSINPKNYQQLVQAFHIPN